MVVLVVLRSWPPPAWEGPSTDKSLVGLFLGGISWVFYRAREPSEHQCRFLFAEG
jgi:hypothetical protein